MKREFRVLATIWAIAIVALLAITLNQRNVSADSLPDSITVTGSVLPDKVIYVDSQFKIVRIETNTTEPITLTVSSATRPYKQYALDNTVQSEYNYIMANCSMPMKHGLIYSGHCHAGSSLASNTSLFSRYESLAKDLRPSFSVLRLF